MGVIADRLAAVLSRNWWVLLLRGLAAMAFGILVWLLPGLSIATLVLLFGVYILADGILGVATAISGRGERENRWVLLLWGLVGIGIGILTFLAPDITTLMLLFYIAIWAITTGLIEIVAAIRLRKEIEGEWLLILGGLSSVLFGYILLFRPGVGALALLWLIGLYAVLFGVILVILSLRIRAFGRRLASL